MEKNGLNFGKKKKSQLILIFFFLFFSELRKTLRMENSPKTELIVWVFYLKVKFLSFFFGSEKKILRTRENDWEFFFFTFLSKRILTFLTETHLLTFFSFFLRIKDGEKCQFF